MSQNGGREVDCEEDEIPFEQTHGLFCMFCCNGFSSTCLLFDSVLIPTSLSSLFVVCLVKRIKSKSTKTLRSRGHETGHATPQRHQGCE